MIITGVLINSGEEGYVLLFLFAVVIKQQQRKLTTEMSLMDKKNPYSQPAKMPTQGKLIETKKGMVIKSKVKIVLETRLFLYLPRQLLKI